MVTLTNFNALLDVRNTSGHDAECEGTRCPLSSSLPGLTGQSNVTLTNFDALLDARNKSGHHGVMWGGVLFDALPRFALLERLIDALTLRCLSA